MDGMKKITAVFAILVLICAASFSAVLGASNTVPDGDVICVVDDFENGNYWIWAGFDWEQYGAPKLCTSCRLSKKWASQGKNSMECRVCEWKQGYDESAFYYTDYNWDFTGAHWLVMDIYNPESYEFQIGAVLQTTENWNWNQTAAVAVGHGHHTIVLDISNIDPERIKDVRRITIAHLRGKIPHDGRFYVDNIRVVK